MKHENNLIEKGIYLDRFDHINIYMGEYEDSNNYKRPTFINLSCIHYYSILKNKHFVEEHELTTHDDVVRLIKKIDIEKIQSLMLSGVGMVYDYQYGFLGVLPDNIYKKLKDRANYIMNMPIKENN